MTSFASPDNIGLIWDVIVTFPLFHELYPSEESKLIWFNSIICRYQDTFIQNINDLHIVNRGVITTMMNDLHKSPRHSYLHLEKENTKSNATLEAFSHKIDEPIQNMSELVQKHMDERVMSFENIFPPNVNLNNSTLPRDHLSQNNFENGISRQNNFGKDILPRDNYETKFSDYPFNDSFEGVSPLIYTGKRKTLSSDEELKAIFMSFTKKVDHLTSIVEKFISADNKLRNRSISF